MVIMINLVEAVTRKRLEGCSLLLFKCKLTPNITYYGIYYNEHNRYIIVNITISKVTTNMSRLLL